MSHYSTAINFKQGFKPETWKKIYLLVMFWFNYLKRIHAYIIVRIDEELGKLPWQTRKILQKHKIIINGLLYM